MCLIILDIWDFNDSKHVNAVLEYFTSLSNDEEMKITWTAE